MKNKETVSRVNSREEKTKKLSQRTSKRLFFTLLDEVDDLNKKNNWFLEEFDKWLSEKLLKRDRRTIVKLLKRIYRDITVHGSLQKNWKISKNTDFDGNAAIFLLKETWFLDFFNNNIFYIKHGTRRKKGLHVDVWDVSGLEIVPNTKWSFFSSQLILDHHPVGPASATFIVYKLLERLEMIKFHQASQIKRFVDFVNIIDSRWYQLGAIDYENSYKTLLSLYSFLPISVIYRYFKIPRTRWFEDIPNYFMNTYFKYRWKNMTLRECSNIRKSKIERSIEQMWLLLKENMLIKYKDQSFVVDNGANVVNAMEVSSFYKRWIIRIYPSWDIYLYHFEWLDPKWGNIWKLVRKNILFIKKAEHNHKNFWKFFEKNKLISDLIEQIESVEKQEYIPPEFYIDRANKKIDDLEEKNKHTIETLEIWKNYKWIIRNIMKFWLFINIGWSEWLLHKSKINLPEWQRIKDLYKIGDEIEVKLLEIKKIKWKLKPIWTSIDN